MSIDNNENTDPNNEEAPAVVDPCEELPPPPPPPPAGTGGEEPSDPDNTFVLPVERLTYLTSDFLWTCLRHLRY